MKFGLIFLALLFSSQTSAQNYPAKPVKLVVPFPAGSATDQIGFIKSEIAKWSRMAREAGIQPQ